MWVGVKGAHVVAMHVGLEQKSTLSESRGSSPICSRMPDTTVQAAPLNTEPKQTRMPITLALPLP